MWDLPNEPVLVSNLRGGCSGCSGCRCGSFQARCGRHRASGHCGASGDRRDVASGRPRPGFPELHQQRPAGQRAADKDATDMAKKAIVYGWNIGAICYHRHHHRAATAATITIPKQHRCRPDTFDPVQTSLLQGRRRRSTASSPGRSGWRRERAACRSPPAPSRPTLMFGRPGRNAHAHHGPDPHPGQKRPRRHHGKRGQPVRCNDRRRRHLLQSPRSLPPNAATRVPQCVLHDDLEA